MSEKTLPSMRIEVQYSTDGLFGAIGSAGFDEAASVKQFGEALENHLYDAYPDAEITIAAGIIDGVRVDSQADHDEVPWIEQIVAKVWSGDDWPVGE